MIPGVTERKPTGYLALMAAIIILAVLTVIMFAVSEGVFLSRFNVLGTEDKSQSSAFAAGCVDVALQRLADNPSDQTTGPVAIANGSCSVVNIELNTPSFGQTTIFTKSAVHRAVTNLEVVVESSALSIINWEEIPNL